MCFSVQFSVDCLHLCSDLLFPITEHHYSLLFTVTNDHGRCTTWLYVRGWSTVSRYKKRGRSNVGKMWMNFELCVERTYQDLIFSYKDSWMRIMISVLSKKKKKINSYFIKNHVWELHWKGALLLSRPSHSENERE